MLIERIGHRAVLNFSGWKASACALALACAVVFTPSKSLARDDGAIVGAIIGAAAGAMIAHGLASSARPAPPPHRYRAARPRRQASAPYQGRRAAAGQPSHTAQTHNVSDPFAGAASGPVRRARN